MRKIAATYILTGYGKLVKNGILVCRDDGIVEKIIENTNSLKEQAGLEYYSGILVPGFVNVHCHLELSHLKGKINKKSGIGNFIGNINRLRNEEQESIESAIHTTDRKMWASGIAAVGDISNTTHTVETKLKSKIYYHSFIESFGFHPERADKSFSYAKFVQDVFLSKGFNATITPHSPYSVSDPLFEKIKGQALKEKSILTIHNQESKGEAQFYKDGTGPIANHLQNNLNIDISHWKPTGKSSLLSVLKYLPKENQLILVHNTFTKEQDLQEFKKLRSMENTWFALCPNSNLFIEDQLPPISLFRSENLNICLGTDSLASNNEISVLSEMLTIQNHFPEIRLEELLKWACINGAKALRIESEFGSFEKGKNPGINLITGVDLQTLRLTEKSSVKRLS